MKNSWFNHFSLGGLLLGLALAVGLVISAAQVTRAWLHLSNSYVINVTGSAHQDVTSDLAVWTATFAVEADQLAEAQRKLKADAALVTAFFQERGITNAEISAINLQRLKAGSDQSYGAEDARKSAGYRLKQSVRLESPDLARVLALQQQSGSLVAAGVELDDQGIQYIYTKAAEAKIEMLGAATQDARERASQIATQGGRKLRGLRSARMGVFQITPRYSSQTSAEGLNDSTSREKTIHAVVEAQFSLE